ncbi:cell surface protein [Bacillus anthracis]|uniref:Cell surface protein n=1 Tax=Bacillus anthracis TaxID=1392 RepID=A0A640MIA8_BACAN|nr:cell surface protein [Bacillus anthracis]
MRKIFKLIIMFVICLVALLTRGAVQAASNDFNVTPVIPENQQSDVMSYFDLKVAPKQTQTLSITISNQSDTEQTYKVVVNTATTNENGIVDYSISDVELDETMKYSLKDLIKVSNEAIVIPANSEDEVSMALTVPSEPFSGVLLGGVTIAPATTESSEGINNVFTRTLAIQLRENDEVVTPELTAGDVTVKQDNLHNTIQIALSNVTPTLINNIKAHIKVTKENSDDVIFEETKEQLSFAPNSKFDLTSNWSEQFKAGKYNYAIELVDNKEHLWQFSKDFEIAAEVAKELNQTSVDVKSKQINWLYIAIGLVILLVALVIIDIKIMLSRKKR